jgi:hypothetical protein
MAAQAPVKLLDKKDILEVTGLTSHLYTQWLERGLIKPSYPGKGAGTRHAFTLEDLTAIYLFMELNEAGFNRRQSSDLAFNEDSKAMFSDILRAWHDWETEGPERLLISLPPFMVDRLLFTRAVFMRSRGGGEVKVAYFTNAEELFELVSQSYLYGVTLFFDLSFIIMVAVKHLLFEGSRNHLMVDLEGMDNFRIHQKQTQELNREYIEVREKLRIAEEKLKKDPDSVDALVPIKEEVRIIRETKELLESRAAKLMTGPPKKVRKRAKAMEK